MSIPILGGGTPSPLFQRTEISRSFAYKLNLGNYQSADFFMAQKAECSASDAEAVSEKLYQFCRSSVLRAVREYQQEINSATPTPINKRSA
jgi:hypothetical protein